MGVNESALKQLINEKNAMKQQQEEIEAIRRFHSVRDQISYLGAISLTCDTIINMAPSLRNKLIEYLERVKELKGIPEIITIIQSIPEHDHQEGMMSKQEVKNALQSVMYKNYTTHLSRRQWIFDGLVNPLDR